MKGQSRRERIIDLLVFVIVPALLWIALPVAVVLKSGWG